MRLGLGLSICNQRPSAVAVYDPAALTLTGWWRASYAGSPWVGTTSAGGSGSRDLTEATNPPGTGGAAINGLTPADFDGTNDRFFVHAWTSLFTLGAGSCAVLFNADDAANEITTNGYDEAQFVGSTDGSGSMGMSIHKTGGSSYRVRAHLRDAGGYKTRVQTVTLSSWNLAIMRWDSTDLKLNLNSLSLATVACGACAGVSGSTIFGNSYNGVTYFNGRMAEIMTAAVAWDDATVANIKTYINTRYALSL